MTAKQMQSASDLERVCPSHDDFYFLRLHGSSRGEDEIIIINKK